MPTLAEIRAVPKVLLHDHLDGGLRPQTVLDLARETGYADLPGDNAEELTKRLTEGAHRGHLEIYLDAFRHTVGGHADPGRAAPGRRPSAPRTWPPTGWSTPRSGSRPSCTPSAG